MSILICISILALLLLTTYPKVFGGLVAVLGGIVIIPIVLGVMIGLFMIVLKILV